MPEAYTFTGHQRLGYFGYLDTESQKMLVADPGGSYAIKAVDAGLAVPPPDGRWEAAAPAAANGSADGTAKAAKRPSIVIPAPAGASAQGGE